jgi:uncharacterized protein
VLLSALSIFPSCAMNPNPANLAASAGTPRCIAFEGARRIAAGALRDIILTVKHAAEAGSPLPIVIFDERSSHTLEVDLRGDDAEVLRRLDAGAALQRPPAAGATSDAVAADETPAALQTAQAGQASPAPSLRGPGRPKLGVIGREVTLLPRHWDWLASQPGGASVALRKLVEQARRANEGRDRIRVAQEAAYRFMAVIASAEPGFEEASRALFGNDAARFASLVATWPADVREHLLQLTVAAFGAGEGA